MMPSLANRKRFVWLMKRSVDIIDNLLADVSQEDASTYRDTGDGWTVLEVVAHLRDFDAIFRERAIMMRDQDTPQLPAFDHETMAIEQKYNQQQLRTVLQQLRASRDQTVAFFISLTDEQWARAGIHPEKGEFSMLDAAAQVSMHEVEHIEQITRILAEKRLPAAQV